MIRFQDRPPTPDIPAPGIYRNVPDVWYHAWDAISNSRMSTFKRSPAHYKAKRFVRETKEMKFGTLCHTGKLEPLSIAQRYVVMPRFELQVKKSDGSDYDKPKLTAAYRELVATFEAANSDKIVVTQDEFDAMIGVVTALSQDEYAAKALTGECEVSLVWIDPKTQQLCKGRVDCLNWESMRIGDLKTTNDASDFESIIYRRGYHRQMAFYCDGLKTLTDDEWCCADLVAAETSAPFCVRAAPVGDVLFNEGRQEFRKLLNEIKTCTDTGIWPGYKPPEQGVWNKPEWARNKDTLKVDENGEVTSW